MNKLHVKKTVCIHDCGVESADGGGAGFFLRLRFDVSGRMTSPCSSSVASIRQCKLTKVWIHESRVLGYYIEEEEEQASFCGRD